MTTTLAPYGLRPVYSPQGSANAPGIVAGIASGYNTNILKYQPVKLDTDGTLIVAAAGDVDIIGAFAGVSWVDAQGVLHSSNMWTAGTVCTTAGSPFYAWVWNDPNQVFSIQCDGALAKSTGGQIDFSNITAGSAVTGLSAATASAASLTTSGQNQLRIVGLDPAIGNAWGDTYTIVQVQIAQHQFIANKVAV